MNMVNCMLSKKQVPKELCPEAVNQTIHVLNRCPTLAMKDMIPEEVWCDFKPFVDHFRVFSCIGHIHIPNSKKQKLDDKSFKCVLLNLNEESKAYRLYDPVSKKVIISRNIVFEEDEKWNWGKIIEETNHDVLE